MVNRLKSYIIFTLFVFGLVFLGAGCTENESSKDSAKERSSWREGSQEISLKGSDTVLPLVQAEAEEFMNENPNKSVTVTGGGSGV